MRHVVEQGECVASIAARHGLREEDVWNHPDNAELKRRRASPRVLAPGDTVHVPSPNPKQVDAATLRAHRFVATLPRVRLRVYLKKGGEPRANEAFVVQVGEARFEGETDGEGLVDVGVPVSASTATLTLPATGERFVVRIGHLDPHDEVRGVLMRLINLGLYCGPIDGELTPAALRALRVFQAKAGLEPTGEIDDRTRAKLRDVHKS
jgi:N-acetylmuramoyl-L-alanine amidase